VRRLAAAFLLALACGCKQPQAQLRLQFPIDADAGVDAGACYQQTSLKCVNYLQFTVGRDESSSRCNRVEVELNDLCDLAKVAQRQEVFKLSPDTPLPISIEGLRVYPATGCNSTAACPPRRIFSGTTVMEGKIGDYADGVIDLPVTVIEPCGLPEYFYPLPDGGTIDGGVATNVIPDRCVVTVNYRYAPSLSEEEAEAHVRQVMEYYLAIRRRRIERALPAMPVSNGHAAAEPAQAASNGHAPEKATNGHANGHSTEGRPANGQQAVEHRPPQMARVPYARSGTEAPVAVATRVQTSRSQPNRRC